MAREWLVLALGLTISGMSLLADYPMDFAWAWTLGIVFQYFTIVPMRDVGRLKGIWAAINADTLSIIAFQAGLFAGMAVYQELIFPPGLPKTTATYWMMMQLAMIFGFFTAWPANSWLNRVGVKEKMWRPVGHPDTLDVSRQQSRMAPVRVCDRPLPLVRAGTRRRAWPR